MFASQRSRTSSACGVWSNRDARRPRRGRGREPDHLVRRVPVVVQQPLPRRERLVRVVHVQERLEVVAPVDHRDVELPAEDHPRPVGRVLRLPVTLVSRRRSRPAVRREEHVARAPDVRRLGRAEGCDVRAPLLHHVRRAFPRADVRVQVEELRRRDRAALDRGEPVLDAHVVPRRACEARLVGAVDVHQVAPVRPLDRPVDSRVVAGRGAEVRVEREW